MALHPLPGSPALGELLDGLTYDIVKQDFETAIQYVETDPSLVIGLASTTLESIYKAILDAFEQQYPKNENLTSLQKAVFWQMKLSPDAHKDEDIRRTLGRFADVGASIATMRTKYSAFYG